VPPFINALMTPAFGGFAPVMQAALPQPTRDPARCAEAIAFASTLKAKDITDLIVAEGQVPSALAAQLRRHGDTVQWQVPGADGRPVTAIFRRLDGMTDDGSWLLQSEVNDGHRQDSTQFVRMHEALVDPNRPQRLSDDAKRVNRSMQNRASQGEDTRLAVACQDGLSRSSPATLAMFQAYRAYQAYQAADLAQRMHRVQEWVNACPSDPSQGLSQDEREFAQVLAGTLGPQGADAMDNFQRNLPRPPSPTSSKPAQEPQPVLLDERVPDLPHPPLKPTAARSAVPDAPAASGRPAASDPPVVTAALSRKRKAPPHSDAPPPKSLSAWAASRIQAEQRAIQQRQLARLPSPPRTPLPSLDGGAASRSSRPAISDIDRALANARREAMLNQLEARQQAALAPTSVSTEEIDEDWEMLSLPDVELQGQERSDATSPVVPAPPLSRTSAAAAHLTRSASAPELSRPAVGAPAQEVRRAQSATDLSAGVSQGLDRRLSPAARDAVSGLLDEVRGRTGLKGIVRRVIGQNRAASLQSQLEHDLQSLVAGLRKEYASLAQSQQTAGIAEEEFVVRHLTRHVVDAMSARSDADRMKMFKTIDGQTGAWKVAVDRRKVLLGQLEGVARMPKTEFTRIRDGYRALDYGIEAMQRAHDHLWAQDARPQASPPVA